MPASSLKMARVTGRLSIAFLLEIVEIGRGDRTLLDGLILLAVVQANVAQVAREPDLQRTYGAYAEPPPDDLRRPVSVSAVAGSLRLPYETVRRRVAQLAASGMCVVTPAGVYVPREVVASPEHMAGSFATYERLRALYYRLRDLGALPNYPPATQVGDASQLVRSILRLFADYFLRTVDAVAQNVGDLVGGLVLMGILRANTEHLPDAEPDLDAEVYVPDRLRRPVSATRLAAQLRLPKETVRRHVAKLVAEDRCVRAPGGLLIPAATLARPAWREAMAENVVHLTRMFAGLAQLGVLASWDAARPPPAR